MRFKRPAFKETFYSDRLTFNMFPYSFCQDCGTGGSLLRAAKVDSVLARQT